MAKGKLRANDCSPFHEVGCHETGDGVPVCPICFNLLQAKVAKMVFKYHPGASGTIFFVAPDMSRN
ncbi:MAG TPA: hypothetical protein VMU24_05385 [Candidatus Acidoferrales bacterium]|nr:hypothetical protein [Candidatus Acidoferrales bacterium]